MTWLRKTMVVSAGLTALALYFDGSTQTTLAAPPPSAGSAPVTIVGPLPVPVTGNIGVAPGSSIIVDNPATSPVLVRDVDGIGAREVVSLSLPVKMGNGSGSCGSVLEVPAGKRLVVEHISANIFVLAPTRPLNVGLARVGALNLFVTAPAIGQGVVGTFNVAVVSQQMHVYSDADVVPCVGLSAPSSDTVTVMVNGYLTDRY